MNVERTGRSGSGVAHAQAHAHVHVHVHEHAHEHGDEHRRAGDVVVARALGRRSGSGR